MKTSFGTDCWALATDFSFTAVGAIVSFVPVMPPSGASVWFNFKVTYTAVQKRDAQAISVIVQLPRLMTDITNSPLALQVPAKPFDPTQSPLVCAPIDLNATSADLILGASTSTQCTISFYVNNLPTTANGMSRCRILVCSVQQMKLEECFAGY